MTRLFIALVMLLAPSTVPPLTAGAAAPPHEALETGKVLQRITCAAHPEQTYALYLPSSYTPNRRWPLVLSSDPGARGTVPLELQKDAAERFGYVLAASNNSRNGPWQPRLEATDAVLTDVQKRVAIDSQRLYLVGFSGGARFSSQVALNCKCAAGVMLSGAGFFTPTLPNTDAAFPVFLAVGTSDFNYREVIPLQEALAKAGYPYWLRIFDGSHQWAPREVMEEAFAWFRVQAMKSKREPSANFIQEQFAKAIERANALEEAGDLLALWREYGQIAATFDSLVDVSSIRSKAEALARDKAARTALKREQDDFQEQDRLTSDILSRLSALGTSGDNPNERTADVQQRLSHLRANAEHEKRPERALVFKRALGGVFISVMESGNSFLESKNYAEAIRNFQVAMEAAPDSEWAWERLAVAQAYAGKKKDALASLRRAHDLSRDKAAFGSWLGTEPAFASLRSLPELEALLH